MITQNIVLVAPGARVAGEAAKEFGKMDPTGIAMTFIAMTVVFIALITLYLTFKYIAKLYRIDWKKRSAKINHSDENSAKPAEVSGETLVAISLALHMHQQQQQGLDEAVITIKNAAKNYSPWSSKIYGLRKMPKS